MKARCLNPNATGFESYGGRGVTVCDRWKDSFDNFLSDVGNRPTPDSELDRIDTNGNYEPNNVRWSDRKVQTRNRRNTIWATIDGETLCLKDWCTKLGLNYNSVSARIRYGWSPEKALLDPPRWKRVYMHSEMEQLKAAVGTLDGNIQQSEVIQ